MSSVREITVPVTKPATEWVNGRALQKVSPQERHARTQGNMASVIGAWARETGLGRVGTEWEFRVTPPHEATRPLVPDVAFLSFERLGYEDEEAAQIPYMAPDVAIEIISPGDRRADIDDKIHTYLSSGTKLVLLLDPIERTFSAHDTTHVQKFKAEETFSHGSLPGFSVRVSSVFEPFRPKSV